MRCEPTNPVAPASATTGLVVSLATGDEYGGIERGSTVGSVPRVKACGEGSPACAACCYANLRARCRLGRRGTGPINTSGSEATGPAPTCDDDRGTTQRQLAVCGDGLVGPGEACDDANQVDDERLEPVEKFPTGTT